ncbi:hypothetical protein ACPUEN_07570 [Algoriphagus yeomjeoni]|uniref:hypothetical protein n=1 Tax=Algoriphagus yeomjeoni TaxID=291403 RepID=UPI003CE4F4EF
MEKIKSNSFVLICSLIAAAAMITIWFLPWRFQVNDDEIMMWLVSGAYTGTPESYAVFIHPILSWTFSKLYTFFPSVPWYPLTWFLVIWLSFVALTLSLNQSKIRLNEKILLVLFSLCLFLHFALFLQFTIVAGIAGFSGLLLLLCIGGVKKLPLFFFSLILISTSLLIRWESFVLILLSFGLYILIFKSVREILNSLTWYLLPVLILVAILTSKILWEKQSEYSDFIQYNKARAAVSDHPISYQLSLERDLEINSKWFFFSQWMMEDERYPITDLKERKSELDVELFSFDQVWNSLYRLFLVMKTEAFKSIFSFMLVAYLIFAFNASKKILIFLSLWMLFFLVFNHFFILNGRVIILFFLPFLFLSVVEPHLNAMSSKFSIIASLLLLLFFSFHILNFFSEAKARKIMQKEFLKLTAIIPKGSLLVIEGYKENFLGIDYTKENPVPFLSLGWISQSPFQHKKLQHFNLEQISDADEYYLLGVDLNKEFYFSDYMRFLKENYKLESKVEEENFILFHYLKVYNTSK